MIEPPSAPIDSMPATREARPPQGQAQAGRTAKSPGRGPLSQDEALDVLDYWAALELFEAPELTLTSGEFVQYCRWRAPGAEADQNTDAKTDETAAQWRDAFWKPQSLLFDARRWYRLRADNAEAPETLEKPAGEAGADEAPQPWERSFPFFTVYLGVLDKQHFYAHAIDVLSRAWPGLETRRAAGFESAADGSLAGEVYLGALTLTPWGKVVPSAACVPGVLGALDLAVKRARKLEAFRAALAQAPDAAHRAAIQEERRRFEKTTPFSVAAALRRTETIAAHLTKFFETNRLTTGPQPGGSNEDLLARREEDPKRQTMRLSDRSPDAASVDKGVLDRLSAGFAKTIGYGGAVSTVVRVVRRYPSFMPRAEDLENVGSFYLADLLTAASTLRFGGFADPAAAASPLGERLTMEAGSASEPVSTEAAESAEKTEKTETTETASHVLAEAAPAQLTEAPPPACEPMSAPLTRLMRFGLDETLPRIDFLKRPAVAAELLKPSRLSLGRWPSDPSYHLYPAQQAVAAAISSMSEADGIGPLVSVNGPPGTGKSWLLRDVAADIVVRRAAVLAQIEHPLDVFEPDRRIALVRFGGGLIGELTPLARSVTEGFFILVASNNNAAIRNITDELPRSFSLRGEAPDYWRAAARAAAAAAKSDADMAAARMAGDLFAQPREKDPIDAVWGLTAATLGRRRNCRRFADAALLSRRKGAEGSVAAMLQEHIRRETARLKAALEAKGALEGLGDEEVAQRLKEAVREAGLAKWQAARKAFLEAHARVLAMRGELTRRFDEGMRPSVFQTSFEARPSQHKTALWVDEAFETARSGLFLSALSLLKAIVLAEPYVFSENIKLLAKWLRGDGAPESASDNMAFLSLLSLLVPVLSTTLASARRLLKGVGCEIDWLFIDEASQASPAAAAGVLMRAKRAVVLGDPRQLMPVVKAPAVLDAFLRRSRPSVRPGWSPREMSLQMLVDRTMITGAQIEDAVSGGVVWTGLPLRTHRRCGSPIFEIANALSYGGQMVQMTPRPKDPEVLRSVWIDVQPAASSVRPAERAQTLRKLGVSARDPKIVPEELEALARLLSELARERTLSGGRVFVLSPFRSVANAAAQVVTQLKRTRMVRMALTANTVHAFQGQEADLVVLILGSAPGREGARQRRWAANPANLFNVAVTRARRAVIVIGDKAAWTLERSARIMAEHLTDG